MNHQEDQRQHQPQRRQGHQKALEKIAQHFLNLMIQCRCELRNQYGQFVFPFVDEPSQQVRR